jgi:tetratricopeptide (TPR) repeat protein
MSLVAMDRPEEALELTERALALDPANSWNYIYSARVLGALGRKEDALEKARQASAIDPFHKYELINHLKDLKYYEEAAQVAGWICEQNQTIEYCALHAYILQLADQVDESRRVAIAAEQLIHTASGMYLLGCYWAMASEPELAVQKLTMALDLGQNMSSIMNDEDLVSLHGDAGFKALVARVK